MNLTELIKRYNNIKPFTTSTQLCIIKEFQSIIGKNKQVNKINDVIISKLIKYYQSKGNNNKTINDKLSLLRCLLKYALSIGEIPYIPLIPTMKIKDKKDKFISRQELTSMLLYCRKTNNKQLAKIILLGYYTGLRVNNILSITNDNYNAIDNILSIYDKKVNRNYNLPVSNKIKYILITITDMNLSYRQCHYMFSKMKQELNLDDSITIHTLRHTFCSNLVNKDVPIAIVKELANHKSITTTMRYTHINNEQLTKAINVL